jgi:hypothetical protein
MAEKNEKLVYANSDHTVHVSSGTVENQFGSFETVEGYNLAVGETFPLSKLAKYQQEAIEAGEVSGLEVVSPKEAASRAEQMAKVKALVSGAPGVQDYRVGVALGDDGSYSDHLVSDVQRVANHAAMAEGGDAPVVAGAEEEGSPAFAGRTDDPEVVAEEVVGSGGEEPAAGKNKK